MELLLSMGSRRVASVLIFRPSLQENKREDRNNYRERRDIKIKKKEERGFKFISLT